MRVSDLIRAQRLSADEAYERFFDGYYNMGSPGEAFVGTMVLSPPRHSPARTPRKSKRPRRSERRALTPR
jgi:hypothetical protein